MASQLPPPISRLFSINWEGPKAERTASRRALTPLHDCVLFISVDENHESILEGLPAKLQAVGSYTLRFGTNLNAEAILSASTGSWAFLVASKPASHIVRHLLAAD